MIKYRMIALLKKPVFHCILIALIGLIAYSNTFNVPFQWDEEFFIADNPIVKDLTYFLSPSEAKGFEQYGAIENRYVGYLTFALNYKLHGLAVKGYHVVNIAVHLFNAILVYFLVSLTFMTPFLSGSSLKEHSRYIALFTGLIFVSHPIQTEAVTYIFQRFASLVTFFYLSSIVLYAKWRLGIEIASPSARNDTGKAVIARSKATKQSLFIILYLLSLLSAVLAMKTQENAFTLPIIILIYEFLFFDGSIKHRMLGLIPLLSTLLIIPLTSIDAGTLLKETISAEESRWTYLYTQFRVVVTYLRLTFLPVNQRIDYYDYPIHHSFFEQEVIISFAFLLSVIVFAVYLLRRSTYGNAGLRLVSFGIFWWFITLSVESSIVPIPRIINEYRVYLPSAGLITALVSAAFLTLARLRKAQIITVSAFIVITATFSFATYARNDVWTSRLSLWQDAAKKSPGSPIAQRHVALAYAKTGAFDRAIAHGLTAIHLKPDWVAAHIDLAMAYASSGVLDKAIEHYMIALSFNPNSYEAHNNLGNVYFAKGQIEKTIEHFKAALKLRPDYTEAHYNLGIAYLKMRDTYNARREFETVLQINPDDQEARRLLDSIR